MDVDYEYLSNITARCPSWLMERGCKLRTLLGNDAGSNPALANEKREI